MNAVVEHRDAAPALRQDEQSASLIQVIERAARDPSVDIDKLERLMAMHERMQAKTSEAQFNAALTAAQGEMGRISADATNPQTRSKYATYGKLDSVLRPIYTRHGFSLSFDEGAATKTDHVMVVCYVAHTSGHSRRYQKEMPADGKGAKGGDVMTKTHASGAAMSYGMRYLLKGIFNVAIGEDDNDGNESSATITEKQAADLQALAEEVNANREAFMNYFGIQRLAEMPTSKYAEAIKMLQKKRKKA